MSDVISIAEYKKELKRIQQEKSIKKVLDLLVKNEIEFKREHKFSGTRKFRFDFVLLPIELKIAIEYEGLMSEKSGHTTVTGYTANCEKYNLAILEGWRVLRYTALNYQRVVEDVKYLLSLP